MPIRHNVDRTANEFRMEYPSIPFEEQGNIDWADRKLELGDTVKVLTGYRPGSWGWVAQITGKKATIIQTRSWDVSAHWENKYGHVYIANPLPVRTIRWLDRQVLVDI
ncbi:hypothetical protein DFH09DRAFT_1114139 [Mycena vulgaris]|nr:hypothetical protein DFH09DRAFT_1114139 [Mycena vulgaris]